LLEEIRDGWLKFLIHLCELDSGIHLKMRLVVVIFRYREFGIGLLQLFELGIHCVEGLLHRLEVLLELLELLELLDTASGARNRFFVIVIVLLLRALVCRVPLLLTLVTSIVLPVFLIKIGVAFFVTTSSATSTSSSAPLCKGGALRLGQFGNSILAVLVHEVQSLLAILGITVVAGCEIILKIHLEVAMLIPTLS
jgi:hypothetical protein